MKYLLLATALLGLGACSTLTDGSRQDIKLSSNAEGALCSINQNGVEIVPPAPVPATHNIPRRGGNLIVTCEAEGYQPETVALIAGKHPMAVTGWLLTGMLVNTGTDALSHAWHEYQNEAYVYLRRVS